MFIWILIAFALGAAFLLVCGTLFKTSWGINLNPPKSCPSCQSSLSGFRAPADSEEALWGGWTCQGCGTKLDKWGRIKAPRP
ncbi:MAG: hypothetical protein QM667_07405 [Asticcacaulis sp.]